MNQLIEFYFSVKGRVSRKSYLLKFLLPYLASSMSLSWLSSTMPNNVTFALNMLVGLFWFWPALAVSIRRFHDINRSGLWAVGLWGLLLVSTLYMAFMAEYALYREATLTQAHEEVQRALLGRIDILVALGVMWMAMLVFMAITLGFRGSRGDNHFGPDPQRSDP